MKKYEISFIIAPTLDKEAVQKEADKFKDILVNKGAEIVEFNDLGSKELAYPIQNHNKGYYFVIIANSNNEANTEFDRLAKISDSLIRHIILSV